MRASGAAATEGTRRRRLVVVASSPPRRRRVVVAATMNPRPVNLPPAANTSRRRRARVFVAPPVNLVNPRSVNPPSSPRRPLYRYAQQSAEHLAEHLGRTLAEHLGSSHHQRRWSCARRLPASILTGVLTAILTAHEGLGAAAIVRGNCSDCLGCRAPARLQCKGHLGGCCSDCEGAGGCSKCEGLGGCSNCEGTWGAAATGGLGAAAAVRAWGPATTVRASWAWEGC